MKESPPVLSLIVPVYKIEKYIDECVQSILNQSFTDYELILIDDGSPDGCPEICDAYARKYSNIHVIHKSNGGVSAARYDGIKAANGEYIMCVDGDDKIMPNCLYLVAEQINKTSADIICHGIICDTGNKAVPQKLPYRFGMYENDDIKRDLFPSLIQDNDATYFPPSLMCKAIKRELLLKYLLVNKLATIGEDGASIIPCVYHAQSMVIMEDCLYYYRFNDSSATKSRKTFNWDWPQIVNKHIEDNVDIDRFNFREQLYRKITHDVFNVVVTQFYQDKTYSEITKEINDKLEEEYYAIAIQKSHFNRSIRGRFMCFALKKRLYFLIYLYSKK